MNVDSPELLTVYWFDVAPLSGDIASLPYAIGNFVLFGFPAGRIYRSEKNPFMTKGYKVTIDTLFMKDFTLFCNSVRLSYTDVESFLLTVDQERKRFSTHPIERKEYLDALHFHIGRVQVESSRFDYDLLGEISRFRNQGDFLAAPRGEPELFQDVSLNHVTQTMNEQMGDRHQNGSMERGIVVLVGNADRIVANLKSLRVEALELPMD